jgi:S-ribosylhomocysteine lyase LuxS involved in autoinducer biosynthesis
LDDPGYEGLGYIELIVDVTDSDAIQKVLDRRYLTGSVGASTDSAICSICKKDWAEDEGVCEHRPGEKYEGKKCFLIAGNLTYDEYSFVNTPADRHSRVIEVNVAGVQDFINVNNNDKIPEVDLVLDEEATPMKLEEAVALLRKISPSLQDSEVPKRAQKILDHIQEKELFKDKEEKEHESIFTKISEELSKDDSPPPPPVDPIREFWGAEYDDIVGDDEWGKEYAKMIMESLTEVPELKDKKLNAASRKKLAGSTFCGPDRSYPVPDCGHAKSAMAYAKKNNAGSAVIACVRRKAKRLGCPFSDAADVGQFISDYFDTFSDDEMVQMFDGLLKEAEERGVSLSDCGTKVLEERITELESQLQTVKTETTASLQKDIETLENSLADAVKELRNAKVSKIVDFKRLTGDKTEKLEDQFQDQTAEVLDSTLKDLISKVDIVKIADKLNSGLSNIPNTTVPDPTLIQDADKNNKPKYNIDIMKAIGERYLALRMKSQTVAENFLRDAKAMGLVPVEYPIKDKS